MRAPAAGPAAFELTSGPDARASFEVIGLDPAAVTATPSSEDGAIAGANLSARMRLTDASGVDVLATSFRWRTSLDAKTPGAWFSYTYDPAAAPTEMTFAVGEGTSEIQRTITVRRGD